MSPPAFPPTPSAWVIVDAVRAQLARLFAVSEDSRQRLVRGLSFSGDPEAATYWLQLVLAMGMATLGLALDSVAVVIGAMLVSPLMSPIVELSLSLLVGASWPLVNAIARVLGSIVVVVASAAFITMLLPFREPTAQILARTTPTALDLIVAVFCAVAAGLTYTRPSSSATSTAAGTAIGISLVPPLCASGFGVGIGNWQVAEGALLLFTANLCAILAFATLFFWLVGVNPAPAGSLPAGSGTGIRARLAERIDRGLSGRRRLRWRLGLPVFLLGVVFIPLQDALNEVSWQVRTRSASGRVMAGHSQLSEAVAVSTEVGRGEVDIRATIVGTNEEAVRLTELLAVEVGAVAGVTPTVRINAVPKSEAQPSRIVSARMVNPDQAAGDLRQSAREALAAVWPVGAAGDIVTFSLALAPDPPVRLIVVHVGRPVDAATLEVLGTTLSARLNTAVVVTAVAADAEPVVWTRGNGAGWIDSVEQLREAVRLVPEARLCISRPAPRRLPEERTLLTVTLDRWVEADGTRLEQRDGDALTARLGRGTCDMPEGGE